MVFWSGYRRYVRLGRVWRVWVARAKCRPCGVTHALLPSFVLLRRVDVVWVIREALERVAAGAGLRPVAAGLGVPHTTARDWWRRFEMRAPVLAAGLCSLAVELGGVVGGLFGVPERGALAALAALAARVGQRLGVAGRHHEPALGRTRPDRLAAARAPTPTLIGGGRAHRSPVWPGRSRRAGCPVPVPGDRRARQPQADRGRAWPDRPRAGRPDPRPSRRDHAGL